jgi:hypothetical protein
MTTKKKPPPDNPVKQSDVDAFTIYVHRWQRELNLMDWRIVQSPKRSTGSCAEVNKFNLPGRLATYRIGENFGIEPVNEKNLERTALHELLHIFLHELIETAKDVNNVSQEALDACEHRVIHVLEQLLVPEE